MFAQDRSVTAEMVDDFRSSLIYGYNGKRCITSLMGLPITDLSHRTTRADACSSEESTFPYDCEKIKRLLDVLRDLKGKHMPQHTIRG